MTTASKYLLLDDVSKLKIDGKMYYCANIVEKTFECSNSLFWSRGGGFGQNYRYCSSCYRKWNNITQFSSNPIKAITKGKCLINLGDDGFVSVKEKSVEEVEPNKPITSIPKIITKKIRPKVDTEPVEIKPVIVKKVLKKTLVEQTTKPFECSECKENDRSWSGRLDYKCANSKCFNCYVVENTIEPNLYINVCCNCLGEFTTELTYGHCKSCNENLIAEFEAENDENE